MQVSLVHLVSTTQMTEIQKRIELRMLKAFCSRYSDYTQSAHQSNRAADEEEVVASVHTSKLDITDCSTLLANWTQMCLVGMMQ
jgi:hypothetical protein